MSNNNNKVLLVSEKKIKDQSLIQLNVESKVLGRTILDSQNIYLRPILGETLFDSVLDEVYKTSTDDTHTMDSNIKTLLEDYIQPYLIHAVMQDVVINLHYKITNKGVLQFNDTQATSIQSGDVEYFKNYLDNRTSSYKAVLINYLNENKLITQDDVPTDTNITENSIGWYLTDNYGGCKCEY
jgi:hypothetical protein